ncbi:rod shape-determining protein MreD [Thiomicrorhabdus lithotrophica]|uniref:Rod shape-determining protein MreD n=1 Tax=Thiomicrorhabdus lithotrophica TaxID=2949997 RepID=A0ABY8CBA7_9GAMM|nr:rod shape-determining protein MreD [Thiomicrorhabdus lithotrophica]WEJ63264.1 rod shape-determining protein MreD [Thiomicrorhabdus lithotrophica]
MTESFINIRSSQVRWLILISYLIGLIIDSMVLLYSSLEFLPPMTLIALLYWSGHFLDRTYFVSAFLLGVLADTLYQTTLGAHALLYSIILFMMVRNRLQFRTYPRWQQAFIIGIYLLIYQILNTIFFSPVLEEGRFFAYWSMPVIGILIWPILSTLLNKLSQSQP